MKRMYAGTPNQERVEDRTHTLDSQAYVQNSQVNLQL